MGPASENPYDVLGVARGASEAEVKAAFRKQMLVHHPDLYHREGTPDLPSPAAAESEAVAKGLNRAMDAILAGEDHAPGGSASQQGAWRHPSTGRSYGDAHHQEMTREEAERMYRTRQPWRAMSTRSNLRLRLSIGLLLLTMGAGSKLAEYNNWASWAGRGRKRQEEVAASSGSAL